MDKEDGSRKADTNIIEIKRLLNYLLTNGYEFEGTREAIDGRYNYPHDAIASFSKKISYTDTDGNWINDSDIKVSIQFEKRADYTNFKKNKDEDEDDIYIGDPDTFITGLIEEIKDPKYSIGGRSKNKKMKIRKNKKMKTRKNKSSKTANSFKII
jgi:hypothetical protein